MKSKWKEMSTVNKVVLVVRIILSIVIIVLALLQILGVLENAIHYAMPLLGVYFLILSIQEWKTQRGSALFSIGVTLFIFIVAFVQQNFLGTWGQYFLYAFLITIGAMLLFSMFSLIGCLIHSFVGYYKFKIIKRGNDIQISYGLLEKHTNTFNYDRIKAVKITQGLVQRMLGFATIRLEVIGYINNTGDDNKNADLGVLVPFCKYEEVGEILSEVL